MNKEVTDANYWDCECSVGYIHSKAYPVCSKCGTTADEQPDSMKAEIGKASAMRPWCRSQKHKTTLWQDIERLKEDGHLSY